MVAKSAVVAGSLVLVLGLVVAFGLVPTSITCVKNCSAGVTVNFFLSSTGGNELTLKDLSSHKAGHIDGVVIGWGDGASSALTGLGGIANHTYASVGNYTVSDSVTISYTYCGRTAGCHTVTYPVVGEETVSIPYASIPSGGGGGGSTGASVNASFEWATVGLKAWVNDTSAVAGAATISSVSVSWGDGSGATTETALGFSATHTYAASGVYAVIETVDWKLNGTSESSSYSAVVNATSGTDSSGGGSAGSGGTGGGTGNGGGVISPSTSFAWSFLSGLLVIGGAATVVSAFLTDPRMIAAGAVGGAFIGGLVGLGLGGMKWL